MTTLPKQNKNLSDPGPLRGLDLQALTAFIQKSGLPGFRARQIFQWIFEKGAADFDSMTNLPKDLRAFLNDNSRLGGLSLADIVGDEDATQKLVFQTDDEEYIESVLMRDDEAPSDDDDDDEPPVAHEGSTPPTIKRSLCVSSQIGCALGCTFCMTGRGGFIRDLRVDEIIDQVLTARRRMVPGEQLSNLVFMGMGEPLLNLSAVAPALRLLTSPQALQIATRRITVSTAGVVPGIDELGRSGVEVNLAVSLNATTQKIRDRLMPACHKWPIDMLLRACRRYPLSRRRRITFEYVLLRGVNDTPTDARRLVELLRALPCKINLILFNPDPLLPHQPTSETAAEAFRTLLVDADYTVSLRRSKGSQHQAACGQLAAHFQRRTNPGQMPE